MSEHFQSYTGFILLIAQNLALYLLFAFCLSVWLIQVKPVPHPSQHSDCFWGWYVVWRSWKGGRLSPELIGGPKLEEGPLLWCHTTSYKFNVGKATFSKKVCKDPFSLILRKMLGLNINFTEKLSKTQILFLQTVMYNKKLNIFLPIAKRIYENLKPNSSMSLPSFLNPSAEELKLVHF